MKARKFILIDDNEVYRGALRTLLLGQYEAEIIAEASCAEEALKLENLHIADFILMDVMMPGISGIDLTKELIWKRPNLKIIAITMHIDKVYLTTLVAAGFKGCIFKNDMVSQLNEALDTIENGKLFFPDEIIFDYKNLLQNPK